ncbi:MAG: amidohydrolase family protein, partial [Candidatus Cloacimonetes bacterium]|nr:amidohydrolase family protein [Candidatus Cloacimonadota bacterium]
MNKAKQIDLLIEAGTILTMDPSCRLLNDHAIAVHKGRIIDILPMGKDGEKPGYLPADTIDARDAIVMPGLVNAHTHIPMSFFRGIADDLPLQTWLQNYIWPLEQQFLSPEFVYDATLFGAAEMIKNGIVMINDMYFFCDQVASALTKAGMRGLIGEAILQFALQKADGKDQIGKQAIQLNRHYKENPLITFSLGPHAIYTCDRDTLEWVSGIAAANDLIIHTHLSETEHEVQSCLARHGKKPVAYLEDLGFFNARSVFAHCVWIDEEEMDILGKYDCGIVSCVDSNLKLCSGFAPIKKCWEKGLNICLGTDGVASNNNLDMLDELDTFSKLHKALGEDPTFLPARDALKMITINGAKALGMDAEIGSLETGKAADILVLSTNQLCAHPLYNPYSQIVYSMGSESVRDLVINGEIVLRN